MDNRGRSLLRKWRVEPTDENAQALAAHTSRSEGGSEGIPRKILYSPGYGAGWSTWNRGEGHDAMLTWEPIIEAIESGEALTEAHPAVQSLIALFAKEELDPPYLGGLGQLEVRVVTGPFRVEEYDGSEHVAESDDLIWPF